VDGGERGGGSRCQAKVRAICVFGDSDMNGVCNRQIGRTKAARKMNMPEEKKVVGRH